MKKPGLDRQQLVKSFWIFEIYLKNFCVFESEFYF